MCTEGALWSGGLIRQVMSLTAPRVEVSNPGLSLLFFGQASLLSPLFSLLSPLSSLYEDDDARCTQERKIEGEELAGDSGMATRKEMVRVSNLIKWSTPSME